MGELLEDMLKELEVRQVKNLFGHEQTISPNLKRLKEAMLNIGQIVDPIIVDKQSGTVLDGNHRLKVLEIIECPYAVCQVVDYSRDDITVGTWFPNLSLSPEQIFKLDSIKHEEVDLEEGKEALADLKSPFMVSTKEKTYLLNPGSYKLMEMVEEQNYILSMIEKTSSDISYIPEEEVGKHVSDGRSILYRRPYTKEEIVTAAKNHSPLPPKSTRHLIPGRIIRLNMRLGWLHRTPEDAQKELERNLVARAYNGNVRKYYEPVVVIY